MSTELESEDEARQVRPFADFLLEQASGTTHAELSEALVDLVEAVQATGKKAVLKLEIVIATVGNAHDAIQVTARVTSKAPSPDPQSSVFYADADGNLIRDNPAQPRLPLRDASAPPAGATSPPGEIKEAK